MKQRFVRALIVDDCVDVAKITAQTLVLLGVAAESDVAFSGEVAWQKMSAGSYDLVIADLGLPGMDGLALLEKVGAQLPKVQRVLMTGFDSGEVKRKACQSGVRHLIAKPFPVEELAATVRTLLPEEDAPDNGCSQESSARPSRQFDSDTA